MTDATGAVVPFNAADVVTKERRRDVVLREDSTPVMTDASGEVVPFNSADVVV